MEPRINLNANALGTRIAKQIFSVSQLIEQSPLPKTIQNLVMLRSSQINGCGWCLDIHTSEAAAAGESAVRINLVAAWRHASVFTDAERAALALAEEGTQIASSSHDTSEKTWAELSKHYEEDQIIALVFLIAMINASNRLGVLLRYEGGSYKHGMFANPAS